MFDGGTESLQSDAFDKFDGKHHCGDRKRNAIANLQHKNASVFESHNHPLS